MLGGAWRVHDGLAAPLICAFPARLRGWTGGAVGTGFWQERIGEGFGPESKETGWRNSLALDERLGEAEVQCFLLVEEEVKAQEGCASLERGASVKQPRVPMERLQEPASRSCWGTVWPTWVLQTSCSTDQWDSRSSLCLKWP